ncbi:MAG: HNH endonuclease [Planctomycetes bacterium]|nr:HNH endonuclease [Planctomycetota bacterium]
MSEYIPAGLRRLVAERAEHICEYCLIAEDDTFLGCEVDHVISEKHGGRSEADNLAYACVFCNRHKGTDIASMSSDSGRIVPLFNPRTDFWREHFLLEHATIMAFTDTGEATVGLLGFNRIDRVLERSVLVEVGRYPSPAALRKIRARAP